MGYHTNPGMVYENRELLSKIKEAVSSGKEVRFKVDSDDISSEHYKLRRILAATDRHRTAHGGEFAGLGASVIIRVDAEHSILVLRPKHGVSMEEYRPDEQFALDALEETLGSIALVEFWPSASFDFTRFEEAARLKGWNILVETRTSDESGRMSYAADRVEAEESVGFDLLNS